jgi:hypothetical protein
MSEGLESEYDAHTASIEDHNTCEQPSSCEMYVTYLLERLQPSVESVQRRMQVFETLQVQLKDLGLTV